MSESAFDLGFAYTDLSPKQRYMIVPSGDGYWDIADRLGGADELYPCAVMGIETREEAEMLLGKMIRGESLQDDA